MATKICGRTALTEPERFTTEPGSKWQDEYGYDVNKHGQKVLVKTGQKNLYEEIQSYADECNIDNILKRVAVGDMSDFRANGIYADTTDIPNNLIEAKKAMVKLENTWNSLSGEVKAKYNNSVEEFIGKAGTEAWLIDMGYIQPKEPEIAPTIINTAPETVVDTPEVKS